MSTDHIPPPEDTEAPTAESLSEQPEADATEETTETKPAGGISLSTVAFLVIAALATIAIIINVARKNGKAVAEQPATPPPSPAASSGTSTPVHNLKVTGGSVAVTVNGINISTSMFNDFLLTSWRNNPQRSAVTTAKDQAVNDSVLTGIMEQYAAAHGIAVTQADLAAHLKQDEAQAGGAASFHQRLAQSGLNMRVYHTFMIPTILSTKIMNQLFPIHRTLETVAHVRHILISTTPQGKPPRTDAQAKALANQILAQIQNGGNFVTLARKYSDDTGSAAQGGDLGTVYPGQMVPQFDRASFHQPVGKLAIVHSQFGYHIVQVLSRGKALAPVTSAQQAQQTKYQNWLSAQQKKAKYKVLIKVQY